MRCGGERWLELIRLWRYLMEWLGGIFSGLGKRYKDRKAHENGVEKIFLYRSVCIVNTSL